jgi:hypothetical protein
MPPPEEPPLADDSEQVHVPSGHEQFTEYVKPSEHDSLSSVLHAPPPPLPPAPCCVQVTPRLASKPMKGASGVVDASVPGFGFVTPPLLPVVPPPLPPPPLVDPVPPSPVPSTWPPQPYGNARIASAQPHAASALARRLEYEAMPKA